ncbi:MAG: hypothetical protein ACI9U0_002502 [Flavobacteriales bacterium]|jgi:hypothetical protein|tara:strand:- start:3899 stop:4894 length:996 start_codon:yes stop_codon:yes gene_type:complete
MKVNIKFIFSVFLAMIINISFAQKEHVLPVEVDTEEVFAEEVEIERKRFNQSDYDSLKNAVDLIEVMEEKRLKADSSTFGEGYGVEKGDSYTIYNYDSISGTGIYSERQRGSGGVNAGDGVLPENRQNGGHKEFQRRHNNDRRRNSRKDVQREYLKNKEDLHKDNPREEFEKKERERKRNSGGGAGFFKLVLIILIGGILAFAVYMLFLKTPMEGESHKILYDQELNPESIKLTELELKIKASKKANDFRGATRLYFAWVIKELSDRDFIDWRKRKTNSNYLLEVSDKPFHKAFELAVKNYEFIWYGKYEIGKTDFELIEKEFLNLINRIK